MLYCWDITPGISHYVKQRGPSDPAGLFLTVDQGTENQSHVIFYPQVFRALFITGSKWTQKQWRSSTVKGARHGDRRLMFSYRMSHCILRTCTVPCASAHIHKINKYKNCENNLSSLTDGQKSDRIFVWSENEPNPITVYSICKTFSQNSPVVMKGCIPI